MATIADLNKNEAVDNNVVTNNILTEQMDGLEMPVEQQVAQVEELEPIIVTGEPPEIGPVVTSADTMSLAEGPAESTQYLSPEEAKPIHKEYFKKEAKSIVKKLSKPKLTFKALKDDDGNTTSYLMKLYGPADENGKTPVLDRYKVDKDVPKERLEEIYRMTRDHIDKYGLETLGTAEGRDKTLASIVSDYMTFGPEAIKYGAAVAAIVANPLIGGAAVAGSFALDHFYDFVPTTEEIFQGADLWQKKGFKAGVKATFTDMDTVKQSLKGGILEKNLTDENGDYKPLFLSDLSSKFARRSDLPVWMVAMNLAMEGVTFSTGFAAGLFASVGARKEVSQLMVDVTKIVKGQLAENKIFREPTAYELSKQMRIKLKDLSDIKKKGQNKFSVNNLNNLMSTFKRDNLFEMRANTGKYWTGVGYGESLFIGTSLLLEKQLDWEVGGGLNTGGSIVATFAGGGIFRFAHNITRGIATTGIDFVNPLIKPFGKYDVKYAEGVALKEFGGEKEFLEAVTQRARREIGGSTPDVADISRVRNEMIEEFRGGLSLDKVKRILQGETNLEGLNLSAKEKKHGQAYIKAFSELSALSQTRMLKFLDHSMATVAGLRRLGIENPETSLGTLFNLNILRGIEPDLFAFKAKRSGTFRTGMLAQADLEEYFQRRQQLSEQLDDVLQNVLAGVQENLRTGAGRAEDIQTEVRSFVNELKIMKRQLGDDAVASTDNLETAINFELDNYVLGNPAVDQSIRDLISSLKITSGQNNAIKFLKTYENKKIELAKEANTLAVEARNSNPIKAEAINSQNIARSMINQKDALREAKNTLYTEANAIDKVIDGNGFYYALNDKLTTSAAEDFRGSIGDAQNALDDLFGEAAQDYFDLFKQQAGLDTEEFNKFVKGLLTDPEEGLGLASDEVAKIMRSPTRILDTLIQRDVTLPNLAEKPAFYMSAKDLKHIESGLNSRMRAAGPVIEGKSAWEHYKLKDIKVAIDSEFQKLRVDPTINLKLDLLEKANLANVDYHNALQTTLLKKTWGSRGRQRNGLEYIGGHEYSLQPEKWASEIFKSPEDALAVYRDINTLFKGADPALKAEFVKAINIHAAILVRGGIVAASPKNLDNLLAGKPVIKTTDDPTLLDSVTVSQKPETFNADQVHKKMKTIDALENASLDDATGVKLFNFDEANNLDLRIQKAVDDSDTLAKELVNANVEMTSAKKLLGKRIQNDIKYITNEVLGGDLNQLAKYQADPEILLRDISSGTLKDIQANIISLNNPKKLEQFNRAVHTLFVQGFMSRFTVLGDVTVKAGESMITRNLQMSSLDFLKNNKKIIKEVFGKKINIDDLILLADNAALTATRTNIDTALITKPSGLMANLSIGSYVSRFNAIAQGRTGIKYIGAEAFVVQMKSHELATVAGLLLNPAATEKIAQVIKSGKPLSGNLTVPGLVWLPKIIGEMTALSENFAENKGYIKPSPSKLYSEIPPIGSGGIIRERELLKEMQQNIGGN
tara:strand:- start:34 stop:4512 length:4479 start_codon:yes stop_codon:yes gene_type:complete